MVNYYYFAALLVAYVQYHSINKQTKKKEERYISKNKNRYKRSQKDSYSLYV